jgi:hypothetical protein
MKPHSRVTRRIVAFALVALLAACDTSVVPSAEPTDIPITGDWAQFVRRDLASARAGTPNGLLEPCWLPDGYSLVQLFYFPAEGDSSDLHYTDGSHGLHIWQAHRAPGELGGDDPVLHGEPTEIGGNIDWVVERRSEAEAGVAGFVIYSARLADGRTVSIDSTLPDDVMERILESLCFRT